MIQVLNTISAFVYLLGKLTAIVDIHRCFIIDPVFLSNMVDQSFFQPLLINLFKNLIIHRSHLFNRLKDQQVVNSLLANESNLIITRIHLYFFYRTILIPNA